MQEDFNLHPEEWGEPASLEERVLPSWPQNIFPEAIENYVRELARFSETPVEMSALIVLSAVATASHKKFQVEVREGYQESVNLWTLTVLPPANRKTNVYKSVTSPLLAWEFQQRNKIEPKIRSETSKLKTLEARLKILRNQAAREKSEQKFMILQQQIEKVENTLPIVPSCPQIWTGDVTNEQLGVIMATNGDAMSLLSDEGGIFDILSGLYSDGRSNIDLLLQAHSGSSVRVDRGSRPPLFMERAILTVGLTIQPEIIKRITSNKTFRGRGLLGRFLYVIPKSNIGSRKLDEPPMSKECSTRYQEIIKNVLNLNTSDSGCDICTLYLDEDAYKKWLEHAKCIESLMGEEIGLLSHITDWAGKLPGAIARIAALLHIIRYANHLPWEHPISSQDMGSAIKIGHVLMHHALVVFDLLQEDDAMQLARSIYKWLKARGKELKLFTLRECKRKFRSIDASTVLSALTFLEEAEIVRPLYSKPTRGQQSKKYLINPRIYE